MTDERPGPEVEGRESGRPEGEKKRTTRFLAGRMWGAATLKAEVIRDMSDDRFATFQALQVVLLAGLSSAMGSTLAGDDPRVRLAAPIIFWLAWVAVAHLAATRAFGMGDQGEKLNRLMRSGGVATTPAMLLLFQPIPIVGYLFFAVGVAWLAASLTGAIRFTYDHGNWSKAVQASIAGFIAGTVAFVGVKAILPHILP